MCLWRAPEKYIAGAALDRAVLDSRRERKVQEGTVASVKQLVT
jgi:hypothetical protein